ncbi:ferritin family protein [Thermodesulfobacteriota bacterium]
MSFDSFEKIMEYAIEKEKEAAEFYEETSRQEIYSGAKEIFEDFAKEERKHQAMLENFSKENIETYKIKKIPDLKRSDYLVDLEYEQGMSYADILRLAMKREEKALKFYNDFSEQAETEEHRKLFQVLAQEEAKHKLRLETILDDYLAEMGD